MSKSECVFSARTSLNANRRELDIFLNISVCPQNVFPTNPQRQSSVVLILKIFVQDYKQHLTFPRVYQRVYIMENFEKYFASLTSSEQKTLLQQMATITDTKTRTQKSSDQKSTFQDPSVMVNMKRELTSPETPYQGGSRKVYFTVQYCSDAFRHILGSIELLKKTIGIILSLMIRRMVILRFKIWVFYTVVQKTLLVLLYSYTILTYRIAS